LVYAVGLPPSIATEEALRKPDYFGQYGKIAKIVLNRNHNGNGDPRRASASAYVTFTHKEDTLACILALDGFYLDGRNIRASYGTSKYCSAFIKNVRCNNPDCTYLHCMGDTEDTFTKQEIQAGYVTSGRDVLARQQQQLAAQQNSSGTTRRRVGGGGPSGSGRVPNNSVFPAPCFDEPAKVERSSFSGSASRQNSIGAASSSGFVSAASAVSAPPPKQRSNSFTLPSSTAADKVSRGHSQPVGGRIQQAVKPAAKKTSDGNSNTSSATTAASVVAGGTAPVPHPSPAPQPVSTLTALTPLKRSNSLPAPSKDKSQAPVVAAVKPKSNNPTPVPSPTPPDMSSGNAFANKEQYRILTHETNLARQREVLVGPGSASGSNTPVAAIGSQKRENVAPGSGSGGFEVPKAGGYIGGSVLMGGPSPKAVGPSNVSFSPVGLPGLSVGGMGGGLGMNPGLIGGHIGSKQDDRLIGLNNGNHLFQEGRPPEQDPFLAKDKWGDQESLASSSFGGGLFGNQSFGLGGSGAGGGGGGGIWGDTPSHAHPPGTISSLSNANTFLGFNNTNDQRRNTGSLPPPGRAIGEHHYPQQVPGTIGGGPILNKNPFSSRNDECGSSALASMLGITLPTGSESLREQKANQFATNNTIPQNNYSFNPNTLQNPPSSSPATTLWQCSPSLRNTGTIGSPPIGTPTQQRPQGVIGAAAPRPAQQNSDIALLQSLLPGVHITSGNAHQPAAPSQGNWTNGPTPVAAMHQHHPQQHHVSQVQQQRNGDESDGGNTWGLFGHQSSSRSAGAHQGIW
jgi:RNA recognition motif-containing protein